MRGRDYETWYPGRGLTVVNVYARPDGEALSDDAGALAGERAADELRDLHRVRVRDPGVDERVLRDAVDGRRQDNVSAGVAILCVCVDDEQVDIPVERGGRDGLELLDVEVAVDGLGWVFAARVVGEEAGT